MSRIVVLSLAVVASSIFMHPVCAEDPTSSTPIGSYQLKNRSTFAATDVSRAPFWPIGHVKRAGEAMPAPVVAPVPTMKLSPEMFSVTSILLGNPSLAIINGRTYGEGEYLRAAKVAPSTRNSKVTIDPRQRIRVIRITDGQVVLQAMDGQSVTVALRRPELKDPKSDAEAELLLSEQR